MTKINTKLNYYYILLSIFIFLFVISIVSIKYIEDYIKVKNKETDEKKWIDKYASFLFPSITLISFFISCYFVSKILILGADLGTNKYFGIYFILLITVLLFVFNNTILKENNIKEYIKGKKFSIIGMIMISGVSALIFGFLDNFGLSLGIEALDHKFLELFLGPFSVDKRFEGENKSITRNLININNWSNGKWRSILNHTLRFKEEIRKIKGTKDLMEDIDYLINKEGGKPLEIPKSVRDRGMIKEYVQNIKSKYDTIEDSKAMIGNTFSNALGAILGAAILNLFVYITKYDGTYSGDTNVDDNFFVKYLKSYLPIIEGIFIIIGCLLPVLLLIAMKRDNYNTNNMKAWIFLFIVLIGLIVMLYLSVKGTKKMTQNDKKISIKKTLEDMKERLNVTNEDNEINTKLNNFIESL